MAEGPYFSPYRDARVIATLTPLVTLLINIDELVKPANSTLSEVGDVADVFEWVTPDFFMRYVKSLEYDMKQKKLLDKTDKNLQAAINKLKNEDVWLPFGVDNEKDGSEFATAVGDAIRAANTVLAALAIALAPPLAPNPLVTIDPSSTAYVCHRDPSGIIRQTMSDSQYALDTLHYLTPTGFMPILEGDPNLYAIHAMVLHLNPYHLKTVRFQPRHRSDDNPKLSFQFSEPVSMPFVEASELHFCIPPNQQDVAIPISYQSDYVDVLLPLVPASQLRDVVIIDPNEMIAQFAGDLRNVHLHANLGLQECPMEELVSARVNFARLTEPICSFLDTLLMMTAGLEDTHHVKSATKIPYIYSINMQTMSCTRIPMLSHDLGIPLMPAQQFEELNQATQIETHLIRYIMFQMILTYRKFTWDDFLTCPDHMVTFDLYLRRGAGDVGYHYDLTPGTVVSSVGLLYSMPHGHVKMGAQLIPRRYRIDGSISDRNVRPMNPFVMRNTVLLMNNSTWSHSTPDLPNFMGRTPHEASYEVRNQKHEAIFYAKLNVTYTPIPVPEMIRAKLQESAASPSRTFLRSWHIVTISQEQQQYLGPRESVTFPGGMQFETLARGTLAECFEWLRASNCMCIEIAADPITGEIVPPTKLPGHHGGKIMPDLKHFDKQSKLKASKASKASNSSNSSKASKASRTQHVSSHRPKITFSARASTASISNLKQQISSKMNQIRAVLENPKKNVVVMSGRMLTRARSHSHTHHAPKKRRYTRKVRSAI